MAAHMSTQIKKALDEWINCIPDGYFMELVESDVTQPGNYSHEFSFGSDDFILVYTGESSGEPVGCAMIEIRANRNTKISALSMLAKKSSSFASNARRFALVLVAGNVKSWIKGDRVRNALRESPVWDHQVINKVHVRWNSANMVWVPSAIPGRDLEPRAVPNLPIGTPLTEFIKIPFEGFAVDGTKIKPAGKQEKKPA